VLRGISRGVGGVQRHVAVHLAVDLQPGRLLAQQRQRARIFTALGLVAGAEVGVRQQRRLGLDAEAAHLLGGHHGDLGQLLGRRVVR
jgi:hypothetical protein